MIAKLIVSPLAKLALCLLAALPASAASVQTQRKTVAHVQYVRIELHGAQKFLTLAEVQVVRDGRNIAPNGIASQSSNYEGALAGRAIDGNTSGNFKENSTACTNAEDNPWWELDLGTPQGVQQVTIWNRTDCCEERLNNFTIKLLDRARKVIYERGGLRTPRPRTDYLMSGEVIAVEDKAASLERQKRLQPAINTAIDRGVRFLKDAQLRDGSWGAHTPNYRAGQTALAVYTLVKCGVSRTDPSVRMGLRFLQEYPPIKTYSMGITMMLYETLADEDLRDQMKDFLDTLIDTQVGGGINGGLWGYPGGCDMSNTQYAALGLLAGHRAGFKVPAKVFRNLMEGTLRNQEEPTVVDVQRKTGKTSSGEVRMAGFSYRNSFKRGAGTHTMTTAGISIIAICQQALGGKPGAKDMRDADASKKMGLEWLGRHFNLNAGGGWNLYFLYGLERVGALMAVDYIGGKHWYWEGSELLVRKQAGNGMWVNETDTCFALLFLSKATAKGSKTGPTLKKREDVRISAGPDARIQWRVTGTNPVTMWITGFNDKLINEYSDPDGIVKGLRILRVDYLCDGKLIKSTPGDAAKGWLAARFAAQHNFPSPGIYKMEARVRLVNPLAKAGGTGETELRSKPLSVFVRDEFSSDAIEAKFVSKANNLLAGSGVKGKSSSQLGGNAVKNAHDGAQGTNWLSAKGDKLPALTFTFRRPVRANTLVLSDANSSILNRQTYDRPTRIEVSINNERNPKFVDITDNVLTNWTLSFKTTRVRTLSIRVLERASGKTQAGVVGFSEVELRLDR